MKPFYFSKLFWLGMVQLVASLGTFVSEFVGTDFDWSTWQTINFPLLVSGLVTVIFRWYTDQPITSPLPPLDKLRPTIIKRLPK